MSEDTSLVELAEEPMETTVTPTIGPTSPWIVAEDIIEWPANKDQTTDRALLDLVAGEASSLMYELSGRQFPGVTTRTVRPARQPCQCFARSPSLGAGPWAWSWNAGGVGGSWWWANDCGDKTGCGGESYVKLSGYPVVSVDTVKIDGAVIDPSQYRLDRRRMLIRMDDPGPPLQHREWPACQNFALDDTQPGTFSIAYKFGISPPQLGKDAATQLAVELYSARTGGSTKLPQKVTKVSRQGVTHERVVPLADLLREGKTGLVFVDAFIAQVNPDGLKRRPAVWSPDMQKYARRVGQ